MDVRVTPVVFESSVPILDLLLRAGLCAPRLFEASFAKLPDTERDENIDAIQQGALTLPQIIWEWAATLGTAASLVEGGGTVGMTGFMEALLALTPFGLEISLPVEGDEAREIQLMAPFEGQRVHLVNRSAWVDITSVMADADESHSEALPWTEPALRLGAQRVGEAWVRLHPAQVERLVADPDGTLALLHRIAERRAMQMKDTVRLQQQRYSEADAAMLQQLLKQVTSWYRMIDKLWGMLVALSPADRAAKVDGTLRIITGRWDGREPETLPATPLSVFISYSDESVQHSRWVRRLAYKLEMEATFNVVFDQYDLHAGKDMNYFMERGVACDRVVVVVTPEYVRKAEERVGGVGYESSVIAAELFGNRLADRFVPILRSGDNRPSFLSSKVYVDFREDSRFDAAFDELRRALLQRGSARRPSKAPARA